MGRKQCLSPSFLVAYLGNPLEVVYYDGKWELWSLNSGSAPSMILSRLNLGDLDYLIP